VVWLISQLIGYAVAYCGVGGVWCGVAWMVLVLVLPVLLVLLDLIG